MPMRFISYLNKPDNQDLFQKYLGKIKHERIVKSKNNELQVIWYEVKNLPPLKKEEPLLSPPTQPKSGFIARRFQPKPEEVFKYDMAAERRPMLKGVKNGKLEENYDQKKSLYSKTTTLKKMSQQRVIENRLKI